MEYFIVIDFYCVMKLQFVNFMINVYQSHIQYTIAPIPLFLHIWFRDFCLQYGTIASTDQSQMRLSDTIFELVTYIGQVVYYLQTCISQLYTTLPFTL